MEVIISGDPDLTINYDEGNLKGTTIKFWGDRFDGNVLG